MISHPTTVELARSVSQWLDQLRPQLDPHNAYLARVAVGALKVIDRELSQQAAAKANSAAHLAKFVETSDGETLNKSSDYDALVHALCEQLRSGALGVETPGLLSALRVDTLAKLAIDQPTYRHDGSK